MAEIVVDSIVAQCATLEDKKRAVGIRVSPQQIAWLTTALQHPAALRSMGVDPAFVVSELAKHEKVGVASSVAAGRETQNSFAVAATKGNEC